MAAGFRRATAWRTHWLRVLDRGGGEAQDAVGRMRHAALRRTAVEPVDGALRAVVVMTLVIEVLLGAGAM